MLSDVGTGSRKTDKSGRSAGWMVRNEQGETFGPVDLQTLKAWAMDGRLAPTNEISENGSQWRPVTGDRALEMDWVAEVSPGVFYGPIHLRAMEELIRDGSISGASPLFFRRDADDRQAEGLADEWRAKCEELGVRLEAAQRETAAAREQAARAHAEALSIKSHLERAQAEIEEGREREKQAARQAAANAALAERVRQEAVAEQSRLRQAMDEQDRQTQRNLAAFEGQVKLAQQQVAAYAAQLEQARQACAAAESRLDAAVKQAVVQSEQARESERQWRATVESLERALDASRRENAAAVATAAELRAKCAAAEEFGSELRAKCAAAEEAGVELRAKCAAAVAAAEAGARAFEDERRELRAALKRAQEEVAAREASLEKMEAALAGSGGASALRVELEGRVLALNAELDGLRQALAGEKEAAAQAEARCGMLEKALDEMKALRDAGEMTAGEMRGELRQITRQLEALDAAVRQMAARAGEGPQSTPVERVYVEVEPVDVLPPEPARAGSSDGADAPRAPRKESESKTAGAQSAGAGRPSGGLSLAELEQQARRELERLGAHGANLFKRKK